MGKGKMRFLFLVQGEGRGHMSQALALNEILTQNGDEVVYTLIGKSSRRYIPDYFVNQINSPIEQIVSPNFLLDSQNKSLRLFHSIFYNAGFLRTYYKSLQTIDRAVRDYRPDVFINFYDFLGGFYFQLFRPKLRHVVIGHQFLSRHREFQMAPGRTVEKLLFQTNNHLTSMRADKRIALSFTPHTPQKMGNTVVTPPLLRNKIVKIIPKEEPFILAYMVNDGYADDLLEWHNQNSETVIHCFWDRKGYDHIYYPHKNFTLHPLDEDNFLDHLGRCSGYATTSGFESVAEALYLGKPILVVPVEGQYEQACNALDAVQSGPVIRSNKFDLSPLINLSHNLPAENNQLKPWADHTKEIILHELHNL